MDRTTMMPEISHRDLRQRLSQQHINRDPREHQTLQPANHTHHPLKEVHPTGGATQITTSRNPLKEVHPHGGQPRSPPPGTHGSKITPQARQLRGRATPSTIPSKNQTKSKAEETPETPTSEDTSVRWGATLTPFPTT